MSCSTSPAGPGTSRASSPGRSATAAWRWASTPRRRCSTRGVAELEAAGLANLALIRGDATQLPFQDGVFDGLCCFAALHLFADPFAALDEMRRVLGPGGRIAIMTSVRRQLTLPPLKPLIERASGMRVFESDEVVAALQERGFENVRQRLAGLVQFVGGRPAARTA